MARQKRSQQQERQELTGAERLGLRVSAMIGSPKAQLERRAVIHRLDTDTEESWSAIMEVLGETEGLALTFDVEGNAVVTWEPSDEAEEVMEEAEQEDESAPF